MKINTLYFLLPLIVFGFPKINFGQAPSLGASSSFVLFTGAGAFTNNGASVVTGDIGTNVGAFTGFPPGILIGSSHVADPLTAQAAPAVNLAYGTLSGLTCGQVIATTLGSGQVLLPDIYCLGAASTLDGDLVLDAGGNQDALFIFKIDGAFSTSTFSNIILQNGASLCNVYWQINGAFSLGDFSNFFGNILANGQIELLEGSSLSGRALTQTGAIILHNNIVSIGLQPTPSVIAANGPTSFCIGGSVTLTGNVGGMWNTGASTASITPTISGDYYVTNTNDCGSIVSNQISVTVYPTPVVTIAADGPLTFCEGGSVLLTASSGSSYLWSTGATTQSISATTSGNYSVTMTDADGCTGVSAAPESVLVYPTPVVTIAADGPLAFCESGSVLLTASAGSSYLWSTGATTQSISATTSGNYSVTMTDADGCTGVSTQVSVLVYPTPVVTIAADGLLAFCEGGSVLLTASPGSSYLWSTGATTQSISATTSGNYSVTMTDADGCTGTSGFIAVIMYPLPNCLITTEGDFSVCYGQTTELCAPAGHSSYLWSTGSTSSCISVTTAGTYSLTVTNSNGCTRICSQIVTITPIENCVIEPPIIEVNLPMLDTVGNGGILNIYDCDDPQVSMTDVTIYHNCPTDVTVETYDKLIASNVCEVFGYYRKWKCGYIATDCVGNKTEWSFYVLQYDTTAPVLVGVPADMIVECGADIPPAPVVFAEDNCTIDMLVDVMETIEVNPLDSTKMLLTRTWSAADRCGNSTTATQMIVVCDFDPSQNIQNAIGSKTWIDENANGIQDITEVGLNNVEVTLYKVEDNKALTEVASMLSHTINGGDGRFLFNNLPAATYRIKFDYSNNLCLTAKSQGDNLDIDSDANPFNKMTTEIPLTENDFILNIDAGYIHTTSFKVELAEFDGENDECTNFLSFRTSSEIGIRAFEIQRAYEGEYETISKVDAKGSPNGSSTYEIADRNARYEAKYRIVMIDMGGQVTFSDEIQLSQQCKIGTRNVFVYPNPTIDDSSLGFTIPRDMQISLRLTDNLGRVVKSIEQWLPEGKHKIDLELDEQPVGLYWLNIYFEGEFVNKAIVKTK